MIALIVFAWFGIIVVTTLFEGCGGNNDAGVPRSSHPLSDHYG